MATLKTPWYDKSVEVLKLNGEGERPQQAYARHGDPIAYSIVSTTSL